MSTLPEVENSDGNPDAVTTESTSTRGVLRSLAPTLLAATVLVIAVRLLLFQPYEIPSPSMQPTLDIGDRVLVNRMSYDVGDIERGQVVVFDTPPGQVSDADAFIKRVVGLPGETVRFIDGEVYIADLRMVEPYLADPGETPRADQAIPGCSQARASADVCVVPEGHVFVLGDNRSLSDDSRDFGPVPVDTIIGRAFVRHWPLTEIARL